MDNLFHIMIFCQKKKKKKCYKLIQNIRILINYQMDCY